MDRYQKRVLRLREHVLSNRMDKVELIGQPTEESKEDGDVIVYDDITKPQIADILSQKGIEHNPRDKKEVLYNLLLGSD